jgi:MiaB/RimO family radical SAM methylthiotransferase
MNESDTEIVHSILRGAGLKQTDQLEQAEVLLVNTCAIRDNAEQRVWERLHYFRSLSKNKKKTAPRPMVAVLGCMAERLKEKLLETDKLVDVVAGPDAYRDLPRLLEIERGGEGRVNVLLSMDETYADITPVRHADNKVSAFISIMRGCENMCSFCIVPQTRGRERSRPIDSIVNEVKLLSQQGYKEVTLLGQNVNSYNDLSEQKRILTPTRDAKTPGFMNISKRPIEVHGFTELLRRVAAVDPEIRIRFTSPHPKDFPEELLTLIRDTPNICKQIHIPAQSGSTTCLQRMRRGYTREAYLQLVDNMRRAIPDVALSTDIIAGFCEETEEEHKDTVSLMAHVAYESAFMFKYSQREKTHAHRNYKDNVDEATKGRRLTEIIKAFMTGASRRMKELEGSRQLVLIDKLSRKSDEELSGLCENGKRAVFPITAVPTWNAMQGSVVIPKIGDYVMCDIVSSTSHHLRAVPVALTTAQAYYSARMGFEYSPKPQVLPLKPAYEAMMI